MSDYAALDKEFSQALECPWCEEITYMPIRRDVDRKGKKFITYKCEECPCEGSFTA